MPAWEDDNGNRWTFSGPPAEPLWLEAWEWITPGSDDRFWGKQRIVERYTIALVTEGRFDHTARLHIDSGNAVEVMEVWGSYHDWAKRLGVDLIGVGSPFAPVVNDGWGVDMEAADDPPG